MALTAEVKKEVAKKIEEYEGRVNHLYLDSVGKVTVGVGHLIPNKNSMSINLYKMKNNMPTQLATLPEKQAEYEKIIKQKKGYKASWYKQHTTLVMKDTDINTLRDKHIDSFYKELTNIYKKSKGYPNDFDKLPKEVQMALFDMIFNLGANKIINTFKTFDKAIKKGDWNTAAKESNRPQVATARNQYVKKLLESAAAKEKAKAKGTR
ncbi:MAG: hypothetical protein B6I30_06810 [Desulfobacteraceae bacterium 4572_187]|nr:MAG: hypothetical protein B6I30_06810 [Desulfobacteraceae bacterium 4572_187]